MEEKSVGRRLAPKSTSARREIPVGGTTAEWNDPWTIMAEHTVRPGDTLRYVAIQYYNSATREMRQAIYEANRTVIGANHKRIKAGLVLKIPEVLE